MRAAAVGLMVVLGACGIVQPTPEPTTPEPTTPVSPPVPEGWRVITTDAEDVTLVAPPDLIVTNTSGGIGGFREAAGGIPELIVSVTGPSHVDQRTPGESVADWVRRSNWLTAGRGEPAAIVQREVLLPAGPALEMTAGYQSGREDRWTILYVIDIGRGYAILQFDGGGPPPDEPSAEVQLMRELVVIRP